MHTSTRTIKVFPFWLALVGSFIEVLILYFKRQQQPLMVLSPDYVWMAPMALLAVVALVVGTLSVLARLSRLSLAGAILLVPSTLVALDVLVLIPGLAHYAAALLALGIAAQLTRVVLSHQDAAGRLVRRSILPVAIAFILAGGFIRSSMQSETDSRIEAAATSPAGSPNLLLITLDTVRAGNLDAYGYARPTMPRMAQLAERGVLFDQALSTAPWTLPSHASMFTGRWPHELSVGHEAALDPAYPTLAEYLRDHGYATAGFVANLKYVGAATGLDRGFDQYEDYPRSIGQMASNSTLVRTVANNFRLRRLLENDQHLGRVTAEDLNARAMDWMSRQSGRPFFAFINYFDAHEPYLPPAPFDQQFGPGRRQGRHSPLHHWLWNPSVGHRPMDDEVKQEEIDAYDGALAYLDAQVGRLLDDLERRGLLDSTVVVVTSDHGEEFGEHGVYEHGYSLYKPGVHVPLIVVAPGRTPAGSRVATPVSLRDLAATIVDVLGLTDGAPFPGGSLGGLWRGNTTGASVGNEPSPLLSEVSPSPQQPDWFPSSRGEMGALVHQQLRYIRNGDGREELYDFAGDPWEQEDLAGLPEWQQALADARAALDRLLPVKRR